MLGGVVIIGSPLLGTPSTIISPSIEFKATQNGTGSAKCLQEKKVQFYQRKDQPYHDALDREGETNHWGESYEEGIPVLLVAGSSSKPLMSPFDSTDFQILPWIDRWTAERQWREPIAKNVCETFGPIVTAAVGCITVAAAVEVVKLAFPAAALVLQGLDPVNLTTCTVATVASSWDEMVFGCKMGVYMAPSFSMPDSESVPKIEIVYVVATETEEGLEYSPMPEDQRPSISFFSMVPAGIGQALGGILDEEALASLVFSLTGDLVESSCNPPLSLPSVWDIVNSVVSVSCGGTGDIFLNSGRTCGDVAETINAVNDLLCDPEGAQDGWHSDELLAGEDIEEVESYCPLTMGDYYTLDTFDGVAVDYSFSIFSWTWGDPFEDEIVDYYDWEPDGHFDNEGMIPIWSALNCLPPYALLDDEYVDFANVDRVTVYANHESQKHADETIENMIMWLEDIYDGDGDGIVDSEDNCPDKANHYQENLDNDLLGDVCDPDKDGDGIPAEGGVSVLVTTVVEDGPGSGWDERVYMWLEGVQDCNDFMWTLRLDVDNDGICDHYSYVAEYYANNNNYLIEHGEHGEGYIEITVSPDEVLVECPGTSQAKTIGQIQADTEVTGGWHYECFSGNLAKIWYEMPEPDTEKICVDYPHLGIYGDCVPIPSDTGPAAEVPVPDECVDPDAGWEECETMIPTQPWYEMLNDAVPQNYGLKSIGTTIGYEQGKLENGVGDSGYKRYNWCMANAKAARMVYENSYNNDSEEYANALASTTDDACILDNCARMLPHTYWGDLLSIELCKSQAEGAVGEAHDVWDIECDGTLLEYDQSGELNTLWPKYEEEKDGLWTRYYFNDDQMDSNGNGLGDRCEILPDVSEFDQEHSQLGEVVYVGPEDGVFAASINTVTPPYLPVPCDAPYDEDWLCDSVTGYPVRTGPGGIVVESSFNPCECGFEQVHVGGQCELTKYVQPPEVELSFIIQGQMIDCPDPDCMFEDGDFAANCGGYANLDDLSACHYEVKPTDDNLRQDVTIGGCTCLPGVTNCEDLNQLCDQTSVEAQYVDGEMRYPYHEHRHQFGENAQPQYQGLDLLVSPQCANNPLVAIPIDEAEDDTWYLSAISLGWDDYPIKKGDGCEQILFDFEVQEDTSPVRTMRWNYFNEPQKDDETVFPFVGVEGAKQYVSQWMGWSLWEPPPQSEENPKWNKFRYTTTTGASEWEEESGGVKGFMRYRTRDEAGYVWFKNNCKELDVEPPVFETDPPVTDWGWWVKNNDVLDNAKWDELISGLRRDQGGNRHIASRAFDVETGLVGHEVKRPLVIQGDEAGLPVEGAGFAIGVANKKLQQQLRSDMGNESLGDLPQQSMFRAMYGGVLPDGSLGRSLWLEMDWVKENVWFELGANSRTKPPGLKNSLVAYSNRTKQLYMLGGEQLDGSWLSAIWSYDLTTGQWRYGNAKEGSLPTDWGRYQLAYDTRKNMAYLVGGEREGVAVMEVWAVNLLTGVVKRMRPTGSTPEPRTAASVTFSRDKQVVVLYGGEVGRELKSDVWIFRPRKNLWKRLDTKHEPWTRSARRGASIVASHTAPLIYVLGGESEYGSEDLKQPLRFSVKSGWKVVDSRSPARLSAGTSGVKQEHRPGDVRRYELDLSRFGDAAGKLLGVAVEVERTGSLDIKIRSKTGRLMAQRLGLSGTATIPVLALRGDELEVRVDGAEGYDLPVDYALVVNEMTWRKVEERTLAALGGIDAQGKVAVVTNGSRVHVAQVSETGQVNHVASVRAIWASDVVIEGRYAYVADGVKGLVVLDISDPAGPRKVASEWSLGWTSRLAKLGDKVYMSAGLFGIQVMDVSNPLEPRWEANIFLCDFIEDVAGDGQMLALSTWLEGLVLLGVTGEEARLLGTYETQSWALGVELTGNVAHVMLPHGELEQVDVSDPSEPRGLGVSEAAHRAVTGKTGDGYMLVPRPWLTGGRLGGTVEVYEVVTTE